MASASTLQPPDATIDELRSAIAALQQERDDALAREAALAEVLAVINRSSADPTPVFQAILERALRLCGAAFGALHTYDGERFDLVAIRGVPRAFEEFRRQHPLTADADTPPGRVLATGRPVQIVDAKTDPFFATHPELRDQQFELFGVRAVLNVPLLKDGAVVGIFVIYRAEPGVFPDNQVALLEGFAAQAVIAIENARLFGELQSRTSELATRNSEFGERIDQQAATIDVLKVISASPDDTQPVFDQIVRRAQDLCNAHGSALYEFDGMLVHLRAGSGQGANSVAEYAALGPEHAAFVAMWPMAPRRDSNVCRAILDREIVHVRDGGPSSGLHQVTRNLNWGSRLAIPLLRDDAAIGAITLTSEQPGGFTDSQVELLKTFAEQAVIAIGSVATYRQLRERTAELTRSVAELRALEEVLRAVNSSLDLETVLATIISRVVPLAQADEGLIYEFDATEQVFVPKAAFGMTDDRVAALRERRIRIGETYLGRSAAARVPIAIDDVQQDASTPEARSLLQGIHAVLAVPLLREDAVVGGLVIRRRTEGAFAPATVALMQTFAAQSVLAIENARLFEAARHARAASDTALVDLRRAQDRLVQTEKMASLGQLTAGIAHEIKNPLNFVNNFSELSTELIDELRAALAPAPIDEKLRTEIDDLTALLKSNLEKVVQHGKRADGIVKNMLLHSRESGGEMRRVEVNSIVEEALNLAYHGARAEKPGFHILLVRAFDPGAGFFEVYPQEFTRVLLNLFSNGFYAAVRKQADCGDPGFEPTLMVATEARPGEIAIRVRDNGIGISDAVRAKMFEPFFTTKPAGEGTGLGLSLSHDIVVKQHGGNIGVESQVGEFTEFIVTLPRPGA